MSFDAYNAIRKREGTHYRPAREHGSDYVRPSRARPKDWIEGVFESVDRGYRRVARKYGWEPGKF